MYTYIYILASSGLNSMYHFSSAHTPVMGENGWYLSTIYHFIS